MKKRLLPILLILPFVVSCDDAFGHELKGAEDLIDVATSSEVVVASVNKTWKKSDQGTDVAEESGHYAELYEGSDFSIQDGSDNFSGFSIEGDGGHTTYFIIEGGSAKKGKVSDNASLITAGRSRAEGLINGDYDAVMGKYLSIVDNVLKDDATKAAEHITSVYAAYSIAGTTAGYVSKVKWQDSSTVSHQLDSYFTMDKLGDLWTMTFCSLRYTYWKIDSQGRTDTFYYRQEWTFNCLTTLEGKRLGVKNNLAAYTFSIEGATPGEDADGISLTRK